MDSYLKIERSKGFVRRSVFVSRSDAEYVDGMTPEGGSMKAFGWMLQVFRCLEADAMARLRDVFTSGEWKYMSEMLRFCVVTDPRSVTAQELIGIITDPKGMMVLTGKHGVSMYDLSHKLSCLDPVYIYFIYFRVNHWWRLVKNDNRAMEHWDEWAKF